MGRVLTTSGLLDAWERGQSDRPAQRALHLLACAYPECSLDQLIELPIGQRDSRLMEMREALFGPHLTSVTSCPQCGERLEISLDIRQMRSLHSEASAGETHTLTAANCEVQFRLPNSADLLVLADLPDANRARQILFERCVQRASRDGSPIVVSDLPEEVVNTVGGRMAQIDPQADVQIAVTCPACTQQWSTAFDILYYLWSEINIWASRILREVHQLASVYGWREADILALSPRRRQFYLELIAGVSSARSAESGLS